MAVVFCVFALSFTHERDTRLHAEKDDAVRAARSAASRVLSKVIANPSYGLNKEKGEIRLPDGTRARWSFDPDEKDIPCSTNNYMNYLDVKGWNGTVVKPYTIHIVTAGYRNERRALYEMFVHEGTFCYSDSIEIPLIDSEGFDPGERTMFSQL